MEKASDTHRLPKGYPRDTQGIPKGATPEQSRSNPGATPEQHAWRTTYPVGRGNCGPEGRGLEADSGKVDARVSRATVPGTEAWNSGLARARVRGLNAQSFWNQPLPGT